MQGIFRLHFIGENAISCQFLLPISDKKQAICQYLAMEIVKTYPFDEVVVGMNNLTFYFSPLASSTDVDIFSLSQLEQKLLELYYQFNQKESLGRLVEIPVSYGGKAGEDLLTVANYHNLTPDEVVELHTKPIYQVYFIGFQAGFPYLGGLSPELYTPRLATPRINIPAGSVGIGGSQTGIYPFSSPGGWQLIGQTKLALFIPDRFPPTLLQAGDRVKFIAEKVVV